MLMCCYYVMVSKLFHTVVVFSVSFMYEYSRAYVDLITYHIERAWYGELLSAFGNLLICFKTL